MPRGILGPGKMPRYRLEQRLTQLEVEKANIEMDMKAMDARYERISGRLHVALRALAKTLRHLDPISAADVLEALMTEAPRENGNEGSSRQ